jgi:inner membrane protein
MKRPLLAKAGVISILSLFILLVIHMVGGVVDERQQRQKAVVDDVAQTYSETQRTGVPFLVFPYVEEIDTREIDKAGIMRITDTRRVDRQIVIFPERTEVIANATTDFKYRGLFKALVYQWQGHETGTIRVPALLDYPRIGPESRIVAGTPYLAVGLSDVRGLMGHPQASIGGHPITFARGPANGQIAPGIYALVPQGLIEHDQSIAFDVRLDLRGTESLAFVPYGGSTSVTLTSPWPHPSFTGSFLPDPHLQQSSSAGFRAHWDVEGLASSAEADMTRCAAQSACDAFQHEQALEVRFIEPVNIYSLSNRAIKYAFLFVELIFAAFFLFELVKHLRIHAVQYLLVGLGIAVFFLLLISLSEHVPFIAAYGVAATACTLLIAAYLSSILGGFLRGAGFGAGLAILFAALYVLLQSEDNALLLGSVFLFACLASAIVVTRKLDWYALDQRMP